MIKPNDLNREQREAYDTWRAIGLTESAALAALVDAGLIRLSEEDKLARRFQDIFGLSESAAQRAVDGRDGPTRRASGTPVSLITCALTWITGFTSADQMSTWGSCRTSRKSAAHRVSIPLLQNPGTVLRTLDRRDCSKPMIRERSSV
jgi:hypothetical protein